MAQTKVELQTPFFQEILLTLANKIQADQENQKSQKTLDDYNQTLEDLTKRLDLAKHRKNSFTLISQLFEWKHAHSKNSQFDMEKVYNACDTFLHGLLESIYPGCETALNNIKVLFEKIDKEPSLTVHQTNYSKLKNNLGEENIKKIELKHGSVFWWLANAKDEDLQPKLKNDYASLIAAIRKTAKEQLKDTKASLHTELSILSQIANLPDNKKITVAAIIANTAQEATTLAECQRNHFELAIKLILEAIRKKLLPDTEKNELTFLVIYLQALFVDNKLDTLYGNNGSIQELQNFITATNGDNDYIYKENLKNKKTELTKNKEALLKDYNPENCRRLLIADFFQLFDTSLEKENLQTRVKEKLQIISDNTIKNIFGINDITIPKNWIKEVAITLSTTLLNKEESIESIIDTLTAQLQQLEKAIAMRCKKAILKKIQEHQPDSSLLIENQASERVKKTEISDIISETNNIDETLSNTLSLNLLEYKNSLKELKDKDTQIATIQKTCTSLLEQLTLFNDIKIPNFDNITQAKEALDSLENEVARLKEAQNDRAKLLTALSDKEENLLKTKEKCEKKIESSTTPDKNTIKADAVKSFHDTPPIVTYTNITTIQKGMESILEKNEKIDDPVDLVSKDELNLLVYFDYKGSSKTMFELRIHKAGTKALADQQAICSYIENLLNNDGVENSDKAFIYGILKKYTLENDGLNKIIPKEYTPSHYAPRQTQPGKFATNYSLFGSLDRVASLKFIKNSGKIKVEHKAILENLLLVLLKRYYSNSNNSVHGILTFDYKSLGLHAEANQVKLSSTQINVLIDLLRASYTSKTLFKTETVTINIDDYPSLQAISAILKENIGKTPAAILAGIAENNSDDKPDIQNTDRQLIFRIFRKMATDYHKADNKQQTLQQAIAKPSLAAQSNNHHKIGIEIFAKHLFALSQGHDLLPNVEKTTYTSLSTL